MMFPNRLKMLRLQKKLTHQDMADFLGITRQGYSKYENGQSQPDIDTINKLAEFFNVTTDYLLGRTDDPTPPEQDDIPEELKDPELGLFFKELAEAPEERREQLLKIWEILKSEGDRKPKGK
ncbi:helix-turn-helix transcriptional regulator [Geobacillus subterraneus]|nr:helix-turn-helix transcriptional regulator [Geobacillus subterraneus]WPZ20036.1 helix-turn-helix transcriptional regulator [Geobacillus subterraneus]